jgi:multicomponent Na+:H+ antiporter subunit B
MNPTLRRNLFLLMVLPIAGLLLWGTMGLPIFGVYRGPYGIILQQTTVPERHVTDVVTSVMFDQRGLDTLGEEFILFAAVVGVTLLLREHSTGGEEMEPQPEQEIPQRKSEAVLMWGIIASPIIFLFGLYITLQAHISVGGGFQGGIIAASAWLVLYLADQRRAFSCVSPKHKVEVMEAFGAASYGAIGFVGLIAGVAFLQNVWPLGTARRLLSGGTIPVINLAVGIEVTAAFVLLAIEFFKEAQKSEGGAE